MSVLWGDDSGSRLVSGRCTSNPSSHEDGVQVQIPSFDDGVDEFGCAFMPIATDSGAIYPVDGDPCLVAFDENNQPWVVVFVPTG